MDETAVTNKIVFYGIQAIITLLVTMTLYLLKRMDAKMDTFQTKENCGTFHASHKEIHALEKDGFEKEILSVKTDVNNLGTLVRRR